MRLEDELKQSKKFSNEYEKLLVNLLFTSSWVTAKHIQHLKPYGISTHQYNVLRILRGSHPKAMMLNDIGCRMIDKNSNTSRLIDKLLLKGLVTRKTCEANRRQVDIAITQKGLDLLDEIEKVSERFIDCMKNITKIQAQTVNELLDKLRG